MNISNDAVGIDIMRICNLCRETMGDQILQNQIFTNNSLDQCFSTCGVRPPPPHTHRVAYQLFTTGFLRVAKLQL